MEGEVFLKKAGEEYARVDRMLDNYNHCEATSIHSNRLLLCRVPTGRFRIAPGNIILVGANCYNQQDEKFDVIHRYNEHELRLVVSCDELPEDVVHNETISSVMMRQFAMFVGKIRFFFWRMA